MERKEASNWLVQLSHISLEAGKEILKVYNSDFAIENKDDRSPLTQADKNAHKVIAAMLEETEYPVLSEEGSQIEFEERKNWKRFWMVDPLDGTKEFIKRNGEFTVNIALIEDGKAILGAIYVPVQDVIYLGAEGFGAFKIANLNKQSSIDEIALFSAENKIPRKESRPYTMVGSRSHMSEETMDFMEEMKKEHAEVEVMSVGSSLKLCMLAEGKADVYPRFAPTMEWDTAAGQAIVEASGGSVIDWESKETLKYNRENLRNNWFLAKV